MDITELAKTAYRVMKDADRAWSHMTHGIEVAPGFFNIHNDYTGQAKTVLLHPESGFVFKGCWGDSEPVNASGRYLGEVNFFGRTLKLRLPEYHVVEINSDYYISVQEYIVGENCGCDNWSCKHAHEVGRVARCMDAHTGNWKIVGDEVVLFDFEGIRLDEPVEQE